MVIKRYKPLIDKYFWCVWIFTSLILIPITIVSFFEFKVFILMICCDVFCYYFMVSSLYAYVEVRTDALFIKFGFILKREIPYKNIREVNKERKIISYSFLSLKNAIEHVNIKYNKFDMVTVSVKDNDDLIKEIEKRKKVDFINN